MKLLPALLLPKLFFLLNAHVFFDDAVHFLRFYLFYNIFTFCSSSVDMNMIGYLICVVFFPLGEKPFYVETL